MKPPRAFHLLAAPLPAVVMGLWVMAQADVAASVWLQNLFATLVGIGAAAAVISRSEPQPRRGAHRWILPVGVIALLATLFAPGLEGVHRWLRVGPLQFHVAAVVLPAMLVGFRVFAWRFSALFAVLTVGLLVAQPDFAQAAAFALAWSLLIMLEHRGRAALGALVVLGVAAVSWFRPDPLEPVPHVEDIVGLAFSLHTVFGALSLLALCWVPAALLIFAGVARGAALALYFAATVCATWLGHFPVPLLGYGMSPILGYYAGVAMLFTFSSRRGSG